MKEIKMSKVKVTASALIRAQDVDELHNKGYKTIICAIFDDECVGQTNFNYISSAAAAYSMSAIYMPIVPGQINSDDVERFDAYLENLSEPFFVYCASGKRANNLLNFSKKTH